MHRSKQRLYSITSSALIKMEFGIDSPATLLVRRRIGRFARTLTSREASNYFSHAGYA